jgi:hypothetical protein
MINIRTNVNTPKHMRLRQTAMWAKRIGDAAEKVNSKKDLNGTHEGGRGDSNPGERVSIPSTRYR